MCMCVLVKMSENEVYLSVCMSVCGFIKMPACVHTTYHTTCIHAYIHTQLTREVSEGSIN